MELVNLWTIATQHEGVWTIRATDIINVKHEKEQRGEESDQGTFLG